MSSHALSQDQKSQDQTKTSLTNNFYIKKIERVIVVWSTAVA
jgi:hypothetical protein